MHSPYANCKFDPDKILLDLSSFSIHQKKTTNVSTPQNVESAQLLKVAIPAPSLEKKNVAYMGGYLIRRYPIDNCHECHDRLLIDTLPEPSPMSQYEVLRNKTYKDTGALIYPSAVFPNLCRTWRICFVHYLQVL